MFTVSIARAAGLCLLSGLLSFGAGIVTGIGYGEDKEYAKRAREDEVAQKIADRVLLNVAQHIANIQVTNKTIVQEITNEVQTDIRYRDFELSDGMLQRINEALTGQRRPPSDSSVPGTAPTVE